MLSAPVSVRRRLHQLQCCVAQPVELKQWQLTVAEAAVAAAAITSKQRKPNLLYIISDQHSPFVTGCYGDPVVRTPNLDSLSAAGVTLDNCYCASPICTPARMSMLTGRHPHQNQCWTNHDHLDTGTPTFAHALGAAGYKPVLMGRMHSNGPDQLHGYAERPVRTTSTYLLLRGTPQVLFVCRSVTTRARRVSQAAPPDHIESA